MTPRDAFDASGPLPTGLTALEASAGTGKTYALSSLAARYVAEQGVPASGLCVVSFTDAATAELRGRIRARFAEVADHLDRASPGRGARDDVADPVEAVDPVLACIADTGGDELELGRRLARVRQAIADFDAATITTIHGFCRRVLAAGGPSTGDLEIVDGGVDVAEVVNDLFLSRYGDDPGTPVRADRLAVAVAARLSIPDAELFRPGEPRTGGRPPSEVIQLHQRACHEIADLIDEACVEVRGRRHARRRRTFDGLLADARDLLTGPDGPTVIAALRTRIGVVLIDEFQDTDRVQWDIFRTAFVDRPEAHQTRPSVVLVGDPKQSIYRFRSAELSAYLDAVGTAGSQIATLGTNWRSDGPLLTALDTLFDGFTFGSSDVGFESVEVSSGREVRAIAGAGDASLTVRWIDRRHDTLTTPAARLQIRRDVVQVVRELLSGDATVPRSADGELTGSGDVRPLRASDIAILTRSNADAASLALALGAAGVPAATSSSNSVLASEAAHHWKVLLSALERPGSAGRAKAAALGWFIGWGADVVATLDDDRLDELHDQLRDWSVELTLHGMPRLIASLRAAGLRSRLLSHVGGERDLTDVDHIAELLTAVTAGRAAGASTLLGHLGNITAGMGDEALAPDVLSRRVDRDDDAVQVLTVHKAKGLEFPVVLCPYLWVSSASQGMPHAHLDDRRVLATSWVSDSSGRWTWNKQVHEANIDEVAGEARRLLYVALTRAKHRSYVWWPSITGRPRRSPLGELLAHAIDPDGAEPPEGPADLDAVVGRSHGTIEVVVVPFHDAAVPSTVVEVDGSDVASRQTSDTGLSDTDLSHTGLEVAVASPPGDRSWRIWSFTSIVSSASPTEDPATTTTTAAAPMLGGTDEPALEADGAATAGADAGVTVTADAEADAAVTADAERPGGLRSAPGGTAFGTLVHDILERSDFAVDDLDAHLRDRCAAAMRHRSMRITPVALAAGLAGVLRAPLGGPLGALTLSDVTCSDRLDELQFHLPLGRVRADQIGQVLVDHLDADDPLRPWAAGIAASGFAFDLEGLLTGSIDLVMRVDDRYVVVDYKTNQLGVDADYAGTTLVSAMEHHHYPLQAVLYLAALHRYLRWRLPDYDPAVHLGGAAYLFLRGMDPGRSAADAAGVFWWTPSVASVLALDTLLAGARP